MVPSGEICRAVCGVNGLTTWVSGTSCCTSSNSFVAACCTAGSSKPSGFCSTIWPLKPATSPKPLSFMSWKASSLSESGSENSSLKVPPHNPLAACSATSSAIHATTTSRRRW
jgi:hypothetical protein